MTRNIKTKRTSKDQFDFALIHVAKWERSSMRLILFFRECFQGNEIYKTTFVAFFQGEQLKNRIKKVCTGFHASLYPCPTSHAERQEMLKGVRTRLEDLKLVRIVSKQMLILHLN